MIAQICAINSSKIY